MTKEIKISYSEDFRDNKIAGKVYSILRNKDLIPSLVTTKYSPSSGRGATTYTFSNADILPDMEKLERMLKEIKNINLQIN